MGAFHAYDIRGIYNVDFDKETAYKVGYFLPELLKADKVLVGRDCRLSGQEIHDYLIKGITDAGADVDDIGYSSTPLVYFGTANYGYKASVQITASHNPREYNGMKVSRENALPVGFDTGLGQIKQWIDEGKPTPVAAKRGTVKEIDIKPDYLEFLRKYKGDYSNLKIAFDLSNGMSTLFAKEIYKGEDASFLFDEMDGSFPNHEPNPLIPKNVEPLKQLVAKTGADIGVIYDGDADRVMFVDDKARFVSTRESRSPSWTRGERRTPGCCRKSAVQKPWENSSPAMAQRCTHGGWDAHSPLPSSAKLTASGAESLQATTISRISSIPTAACLPPS